jgi:hypothetical protein
MTRLSLTSGGRRRHGLPRPTLDEQRISDSPEGVSDDAPEGTQLRRPTL